MGLVPVVVRETVEGGAGVDPMDGIRRHPLGPECADGWWWGGLRCLQVLELGVY